MIVFFIGLVIGAWLGVAVMACCARSGDDARCEECRLKEYRFYCEHHEPEICKRWEEV